MHINKVIKNSGMVFFGRIFNLLSDFFVSVYLVRYLGSNDFGIYSFVTTYILFFTLVSLSGMDKILVREFSKKERASEKIFGNALTIRSILAIVGIFLSIILVNILNYPASIKLLVYFASISLLFTSLRIVYRSVFQSFLKMEYSVFSDLIGKIIYVIIVIIILLFNGNIFHLILGVLVSNLFSLISDIIFSKKLIKSTFKFDLACIKNIVMPSIPLTVAGFFFMINHRVDVIMISSMASFKDVGYYSAAYKLVDALIIIPATLMISFFPLMVREFKDNKNIFFMLHEQSIRWMLIAAIPLAVLTSMFSNEIILILYGNGFSPSSYALQILLWAEVFVFINFVYFDTFISMEKTIILTKVMALVAILNVILNYLLIPKYSFIGASWATLFCQALGSSIFFYCIYTRFPNNSSYMKNLIKMLFLALSIYLFLLAFDFVSKYILAVLFLSFYIIMLFLLKILQNKEIDKIRNLIKIFYIK